MTEIERYLAEEVAIDHVDGLISRREALRRLALMGIGTVAASSILAACARDNADRPTPSPTGAATATSAAAATAKPTENITFDGPEGRKLQGSWAKGDPAKGAVLVIHENRGLNDHIRSVAGRLAGEGYSSLAIDLLSEEGGTGKFTDPAEATAALNKVPPERFLADMKAGLSELARREPNAKLGAVGFCFGGGMVWRLIASKDERLAAAAPFYGTPPDPADFTGSKAAVLAVYGALDSRVNATRDAARAALEKAKLTHQIETFEGADHAFFNDTGPRYNPQAATEVYRKLLDWFDKHLA